ncbi:MAG: ABC transporter ATP-binding protein [Coriobacteriia bacterium]|nr:ABC transporter ATP-binding protein [Coriobacteriia bacterium]
MRLRNFGLRYGKRPVLQSVNVELPEGKVNHLLGRNGAGKSSLAKALAGLIPYEGDVIGEKPPITVIGSYSQVPDDLSVSDVVEIVRRRAGAELFTPLMDGLGITELPETSKLGRLSDGQRQKMKLLFFLSGSPRTIVLDEVTNALDRTTAHEICRFLDKYLSNPGITSINITHEISDLDWIHGNYFLLEGGSIVPVTSKREIVDRYMGVAQP